MNDRIRSSHPREKPAIRPMTRPMTVEKTVAAKATISEVRRP